MEFKITKEGVWTPPDEEDRFRYDWTLEDRAGALCRSAVRFDSEADARANIAGVKRAMKGANYAKVVTA